MSCASALLLSLLVDCEVQPVCLGAPRPYSLLARPRLSLWSLYVCTCSEGKGPLHVNANGSCSATRLEPFSAFAALMVALRHEQLAMVKATPL